MLPVYRIRAATPRDAQLFAPVLRAPDIEEIRAASGLAPLAALQGSLAFSTHAWTALAGDGAPLAIWGVGPLSLALGKGCPWLLATEAFDALPRHLVARLSRRLLSEILACYPSLENRVDARHKRAIRWLGWLGFTIEPPVSWGIEKRPFRRFSLVARDLRGRPVDEAASAAWPQAEMDGADDEKGAKDGDGAHVWSP